MVQIYAFPGWNFNNVKIEVQNNWNNLLSRLKIVDNDNSLYKKEQKIMFYTHLYHSMLVPSNVTAYDGNFKEAVSENVKSSDFKYYSTWSTWDDFRKYSLLSLIVPNISRDIARSIIDIYQSRGKYIDWADSYWPSPSVRQEFFAAIVLDAFNKGLLDFAAPYTKTAYTGVKEDVIGFGKKDTSLSGKLENAYQAYFAYELGKALNSNDTDVYLKKALDYKNYWCKEQKDNQGDLRGFFTPDGKVYKKGVQTFNSGCYEGNLWHYRWFVPHDMKGLIKLRQSVREPGDIGDVSMDVSRERLSGDLEKFFEKHYYMAVNEPDLHAPYIFDYLGKPYLTQKWARTFTTKIVIQIYQNHGKYIIPQIRRIYTPYPKGYLKSMDDDTGAMSSWYVMSAMGLFPFTPGDAYYVIGSPIFREIDIDLGNGKIFKVKADNVSGDNYYIQSAILNGKPYNKCWISYSDIEKGGVLEFKMSDKPNKNWAADAKLAPPSLSDDLVNHRIKI